MDETIKGKIFYVPYQEINDRSFDRLQLDGYSFQNLSRIIIRDNEKVSGSSILICDVMGDRDNWDASIRAFLYGDGKCLGTFKYISDAKVEDEKIEALILSRGSGTEILGTTRDTKGIVTGFYLVLDGRDVSKVKNLPDDRLSRRDFTKASNRRTPENSKSVDILNLKLLSDITARAKKKSRKSENIFDLYNYFVSAKPTAESIDDLLIAISIAYSWMPTMLDIHVTNKKGLQKLLVHLQRLGNIKNLKDFLFQIEQVEESLLALTAAINHSIVGTSKVLHLFFPEYIPIIDSNVLKGWNIILGRQFSRHPELQLPKNIPSVAQRQVTTYMKYWQLMLQFKKNTNSKTLRVLEEPFYLIGRR